MSSASDKVYEYVTERVLSMLGRGTVPWARPWTGGERPRSGVTRKEYRGINAIMLHATQMEQGWSVPYWYTFRQIKEHGGRVKKGERSSMVVFWKSFTPTDKAGNEVIDPDTGRPMVRWLTKYYNVFNAQQFIGGPQVPSTGDTPQGAGVLETAEALLMGYIHGSNGPNWDTNPQAHYCPSTDTVAMPPKDTFHSTEGYYATAFHEAGHSTGHESRLNRIKGSTFGSQTYAAEELTAEMCAAFCMGLAGSDEPIIENTAAYVDNWRKAISDDPRLVVNAAQRAQKAADLIAGVSNPI